MGRQHRLAGREQTGSRPVPFRDPSQTLQAHRTTILYMINRWPNSTLPPPQTLVFISVHCTIITITINHLIQLSSDCRLLAYPVGLPVSIADSGVITSIAIHCPKLRARSPHRLSKHINWPAVLVLLSGPHLPPALSTKGVIGRPGPGCTVSIQPGDTAQRSGLAVSTRIPRRWPLWTLIKNSLAE